MKKTIRVLAVVAVFAFALSLFAVSGCAGSGGKQEAMYFSMPMYDHAANTAEGWTIVPYEVYRYTGGETYSLAYTFPDTQDYAFCVSGAHLYYVPALGGPVTAVELIHCTEATLGEVPSGWISCLVAEEREWGDRVFVLWTKGTQHVLYEVAAQRAKVICEDVVENAELALGDGGLFYIDNGDGMALMRYDLNTGETRKIADKVGLGKLEYDGGYVYSGNVDTLRYDVKTGESSLAASWSGWRVRDGWLYYTEYADDSADRDPAWTEILRRNLKSGKTQSCGTAYMPYLWDLTLRYAVQFGKKGFIACITYLKEDTEYMFFPYGASQGIKLCLQ